MGAIVVSMPKKPTAGQRKKSHKNVKRQPGSLKLWKNEHNGFIHEVVNVHRGRVTIKLVGPESQVPDVAHEFFKTELKAGLG